VLGNREEAGREAWRGVKKRAAWAGRYIVAWLADDGSRKHVVRGMARVAGWGRRIDRKPATRPAVCCIPAKC